MDNKRGRENETFKSGSHGSKNIGGKIIYRCTFCNFLACTEGNIVSHEKAKHEKQSENENLKFILQKN